MSDLIPQIEQTIRRHRCFLPGQGILVAVSGGLDSMVLLDVMRLLAPRFGWRLVVGHFNHQLRGAASAADARARRAADSARAVARAGCRRCRDGG